MPKVTKVVEVDVGYHEASNELVDYIRKCVVPLCIVENDQIISVGSGTIVSSWGMILTASHVLEAAIRAGRPRAKDGRKYQEYNLYALVNTGVLHPNSTSEKIGGLVKIVDLYTVPELDVGFCSMEGLIEVDTGKRFEFDCMPLNLKPPENGQRCFALGFPVSEGISSDGMHYDYEESLFTTDGKIIEVFPTGRDKVVLPYPCFTVEGKFEHNMSGGPVFLDGEFGVSGIISRGLDDMRSYASMVWPSMGISTNWPEDKPNTIGEAVRREYIACVQNGYGVRIEMTKDGKTNMKLTQSSELVSKQAAADLQVKTTPARRRSN